MCVSKRKLLPPLRQTNRQTDSKKVEEAEIAVKRRVKNKQLRHDLLTVFIWLYREWGREKGTGKLNRPSSFACVNVETFRPVLVTPTCQNSIAIVSCVESSSLTMQQKPRTKCQNVLFQLSNSICEAYLLFCCVDIVWVLCIFVVFVGVLLLCVRCCCVCCCCVCNYAYDYLMTFSFCI